ncbi:MAG: prenyltransferase/squalene oxidase repeat-containing protein [Planctomycetota bacterium]|jgi:hypothetical protein
MKSIDQLCLILAMAILAGLLLSSDIAVPGDDDDKVKGVDVDPERIDAAIDKAVKWLRDRQEKNGSWITDGSDHTKDFNMGYTALITFALLKGGVGRNDPAVIRSFSWLEQQELVKTYDVSCYVLALEARYAPPLPKASEKDKKSKSLTVPYEEQVRRNWLGKARPKDRKKMQELIEWLLSKQTETVWRYPGGYESDVDNSNTQYVLLALNAGLRCGCKIPVECWKKTAEYFLKAQEKDGPDVKPFVVPAADWSIAKLKKVQKKFLRRLETARRKEEAKKTFGSRKKKEEGEEETEKKEGEEKKKGPRTRVIDPEEYGLTGLEGIKMKARGWSYIPAFKREKPEDEKFTGSMTTSGVASLVICKAALEVYPAAWLPVRKHVNQTIRDGCAWLAHNFSATANPNSGHRNYYYYLYGLERAGVLTCCELLGEHDWYSEGAKAILDRQNTDGSWPDDNFAGSLANTCFCILFLKRATTPLIGNPTERVIWTGSGLTKDKK